jgi:hypothetical protein
MIDDSIAYIDALFGRIAATKGGFSKREIWYEWRDRDLRLSPAGSVRQTQRGREAMGRECWGTVPVRAFVLSFGVAGTSAADLVVAVRREA